MFWIKTSVEKLEFIFQACVTRWTISRWYNIATRKTSKSAVRTFLEALVMLVRSFTAREEFEGHPGLRARFWWISGRTTVILILLACDH